MKINKDTKLFFSVSSNPGNFGATLYNEAFKCLGINAIYKPLKLEKKSKDDYKSINYLLSSLCFIDGFSGLSVSMPFKKDIVKYCEFVDKEANEIGNINTIKVDKDMNFKGFNTDAYGFEKSCKYFLENAKTAFIVGRGALSDTISYVLDKRNIDYCKINARDGLESGTCYGADWLINASPIGMPEFSGNGFFEELFHLAYFQYVFDCVSSKNETDLINLAIKRDLTYVEGLSMQIHMWKKQAEIYTGQEISEDLLEKLLIENGYC